MPVAGLGVAPTASVGGATGGPGTRPRFFVPTGFAAAVVATSGRLAAAFFLLALRAGFLLFAGIDFVVLGTAVSPFTQLRCVERAG